MADPKNSQSAQWRSGYEAVHILLYAGSHVHTRVPPHLPPPQMPIDRWHPIDAKPCSLDHSGLSGSLPHAPLSHHKSPLPRRILSAASFPVIPDLLRTRAYFCVGGPDSGRGQHTKDQTDQYETVRRIKIIVKWHFYRSLHLSKSVLPQNQSFFQRITPAETLRRPSAFFPGI